MKLRTLAVAVTVVALTACSDSTGTSGVTPANPAGKGPKITVAMVTHGQSFDPFWSLVQKGAQQAASDYNVTLKYQSPKATDPHAQASLITQATSAKPAGLVVTIPDPSVLSDPVRQAVAAGIPVTVVNVGDTVYQDLGALTFVGQPEKVAGAEAATQMTKAGVKKALCVIHEEKNQALTDRCAGFTEQLSSQGGSVQTLHVNGARLDESQAKIEQALQKDKAIDGLLAVGIIGFNAAGGALKVLNKFGTVKLGSFDVSAANLAAVQSGQALFVIDQQPFLEGYDSVQVAAFQARYGQHPFRPIYTGPSVITKSNAAKVVALYKATGIPLFKGGYPQ
jgi:simple sugar transport system substrate-binding protein